MNNNHNNNDYDTGCDIGEDVYGYGLPPKYMNKSTSELSYPLHCCLLDVTTAIFSEKAINYTAPNWPNRGVLLIYTPPLHTHTHTHTHKHTPLPHVHTCTEPPLLRQYFHML